MVRTHVVMSGEVVAQIDRVVGQRGRSRFFEEAAREKLARLALAEALDETFGIARGPGYAHWKDRRAAATWVRRLRRPERKA